MEIKKPNKKTATIILIALIVIISAGVFYLLFLRKDAEERWYDSNWSYRRTVYINKIPRQFQGTQQDVLIEIDTQRLIEEEKLQRDCRDIRFVDENNRNTLQYWIEGGCNTKESQIWARVQLPQESQKVIYLYYGNKFAIQNQEEWDGEFITMSSDSCQGNWGQRDDFDGRFPVAGEEYNVKGGQPSHDHKLFEIPSVKCLDPVAVIYDGGETCDFTKDNILSENLSEYSNIPDYENMNFCGSKNGYLTGDSVILSTKNTPENWEHITALDNKYPRGDDGQNPEVEPSHLHKAMCLNRDLSINDGEVSYLKLDNESKTLTRQSEPPYYTINFISPKDNSPIPTDTVMMVSSIPPLGWEPYTEANGRFLKGNAVNWNETEDSEDPHYHIPDINISISKTDNQSLSDLNTTKVCLENYLEQEEQTSENSIIPPHITVPLAKKKNYLTGNLSVAVSDDEQERGTILGTTGSGPSKPSGLEAEGQTNPQNLTTTTPGFTAIFNHPDYP
jgi:hypothetical protein